MKQAVTVIGGANVDIGGRPAAALALHDSNPGFVTQRFGGVGRNVAHNLALLGLPVSFITALGGDLYGSGLRESCRAPGPSPAPARRPSIRSLAVHWECKT